MVHQLQGAKKRGETIVALLCTLKSSKLGIRASIKALHLQIYSKSICARRTVIIARSGNKRR